MAKSLEEVIKEVETSFEENKSYTAELNLIVKVDSNLKKELLKSELDEPKIQNLTLELSDGSHLKTETLLADTIQLNKLEY